MRKLKGYLLSLTIVLLLLTGIAKADNYDEDHGKCAAFIEDNTSSASKPTLFIEWQYQYGKDRKLQKLTTKFSHAKNTHLDYSCSIDPFLRLEGILGTGDRWVLTHPNGTWNLNYENHIIVPGSLNCKMSTAEIKELVLPNCPRDTEFKMANPNDPNDKEGTCCNKGGVCAVM